MFLAPLHYLPTHKILLRQQTEVDNTLTSLLHPLFNCYRCSLPHNWIEFLVCRHIWYLGIILLQLSRWLWAAPLSQQTKGTQVFVSVLLWLWRQLKVSLWIGIQDSRNLEERSVLMSSLCFQPLIRWGLTLHNWRFNHIWWTSLIGYVWKGTWPSHLILGFQKDIFDTFFFHVLGFLVNHLISASKQWTFSAGVQQNRVQIPRAFQQMVLPHPWSGSVFTRKIYLGRSYKIRCNVPS